MYTEKYRPKTWDDVLGHEDALKVLKSVLEAGNYPSALLFHGPHGTGKTSLARLFASYLLGEPSENLGSSANYREVDAASSGSVEFVRGLVEESQYVPLGGIDRRVVVLDECHMLSTSAQNALLKILESNSSTVFVFCTTDPKRMLPPLKARCLPLPTGRVSPPEIVNHLASISSREGKEFEREALELLVAHNRSHIRDSLISLEALGQVGSVTLEEVRAFLGYDIRHEYYLLLLDILSIDDFSMRLDRILRRALPEDVREGLLSVCLSVYKSYCGAQSFEDDVSLRDICAEVAKQLGKRALKMLQFWSARRPTTRTSLECDLICFKSCVETGFPGELQIDLPQNTKEFVSELDRIKHLGYKKFQKPDKKDKDKLELTSVEDFQKILGGKII